MNVFSPEVQTINDERNYQRRVGFNLQKKKRKREGKEEQRALGIHI
jgi:hypothetical protein